MKRRIKIGIAAAIVLVIGLAYKNYLEADAARGAGIGALTGGAVLGLATRSPWGAVGGLLGGAALGGAIGGSRRRKRDRDHYDNEYDRDSQRRNRNRKR